MTGGQYRRFLYLSDIVLGYFAESFGSWEDTIFGYVMKFWR